MTCYCDGTPHPPHQVEPNKTIHPVSQPGPTPDDEDDDRD